MKGIIPMIVRDNHPGDAEAAGAVAAMQEIHSGEYRPTPGDIVIVAEPFTLDPVRATVTHAHGHVVLVVTDKGEILEYDIDEVQRI